MKRKRFGIQIKEGRVFPKKEIMDTIINVQLHPKTGDPMWRKREVEQREKVAKGQHMFYQSLLRRQRGRGEQLYRRIVIA